MNNLQGNCLYINPGNLLFYGNFNRNELDGLGIVRYMQGDILIGKWVKNKLNGHIFYYNKQINRWAHLENIQGKTTKIIDMEESIDPLNPKMLIDFTEYQILLGKGLYECFQQLEAENKCYSLNLLDIDSQM